MLDRLRQLMSALTPGFIRYPSGRTANGFYPGTYPIWWRDSIDRLKPSPWPIWTLDGGEMTGSFGVDHFMDMARSVSAIPILVLNSGFTDPGSRQRIEDVALLPRRIEHIFGVARSHSHDSLIIQLGYGVSNPEYERRFGTIAKEAAGNNLSASLTAGGSLLWNDRKYSDHVVDLALPPLREPDLLGAIPTMYHLPEQAPEPIMLGEVHFDGRDDDHRSFVPLFVLKAATLIDAEHHSHLIRGISLYPTLSEDPSDVPLILVRGAKYEPGLMYDFISRFTTLRGPVLRRFPEEHTPVSGLVISLTSDEKGEHFYLKAANTTRHPLTYRLKIRGTNIHLPHAQLVRYLPVVSTTTMDKGEYDRYTSHTEMLQIPLHQDVEITIAPFEVLLIHLSHHPL